MSAAIIIIQKSIIDKLKLKYKVSLKSVKTCQHRSDILKAT